MDKQHKGMKIQHCSQVGVAYLYRVTISKLMIVMLMMIWIDAIEVQAQPTIADPVVATPGDTPTAAEAGQKATGLSASFNKHDLANAMKLVADWQLRRLPAKAQTDWTFAALYAGFMAVPESVSGSKYKCAMMHIGEETRWQPGPRLLHADDHAVGQTYLELYFDKKDVHMISPIRERMDKVMVAPEEPNKLLWWWCDALFMDPPVFAGLTAATGDQKYVIFMDQQWSKTSSLLYDPKVHLFSRDASFLNSREKNGQKIFWSRGNGWVMAGLVRVLQRLPANSPLRPKYVLQLQQMAASTAALQSEDGLWRAGLLDADSYPLPEVSGSAFITYAMAYGVNEGILNSKIYTPILHKAWQGMISHVYADGRLGCIQPVGAAPDVFMETSSYVYGVGAYLLAGSEIYRMAK